VESYAVLAMHEICIIVPYKNVRIYPETDHTM